MEVMAALTGYLLTLAILWKVYFKDEIKRCKCIKDFFIEPDEE